MEPILHFQDVALDYRVRTGLFRSVTVNALRDVTLNVCRGESLGVIGRNGAGKSTLLKLMAGIIRPDRGTVDRGRSRVAMLSLKVGFVRHLTGRENVVLSGLLLGLSKKEIDRKFDAIVEFAELEDAIHLPVYTYSAGMKARLGFAVAFQLDPDVLLIDEVVAVGDGPFRIKSQRHMHERIQSDRTIVLVSHNLPTVHELCDRVVWVEDGTIRREGAPELVIPEYLAFCEERAAGLE